jgi:hypothetical protein
VEHIPPDALQRILQEARRLARGDGRAVLALLQGCYLEEAIRVSIEEQGPERQLAAVQAFCATAGHRLLDAAAAYGRGQGSPEERRVLHLGRLHNAQDEGQRFADSLRNRLETEAITRTPPEEPAEPAAGGLDELTDDA